MMDVPKCDSPVSECEADSENDYEYHGSVFLNLPIEVFLHICSFLDARFITQSLSLVCKHFNTILTDNSIWKSRIAKHLNGVYPALPVKADEFNWGSACAVIEDEYNLWHNKDKTMRRVLLKDVHFASVDAILLMKSATLCFSGSRDHNLVAWSLSEPVLEGTMPKSCIPNAHKGWIWNLTSLGDKLYSCSWDATVKTWDIEEGLREMSVFSCKHPALAMVCEPTLLAVGLFNRHVMLFDPRTCTSIAKYGVHTGAVLALSMINGYIVSASEDRSLAVWDPRACKLLKKKTLYGEDSEKNAYPMSLSYSNDTLYIGDVKGQLHLMDPRGGQFELVETFDVGHKGKLTGIQHNPGCVMTCSTDGTMRILSPTRSLDPISIIKSRGGEITKFDYKDRILAMGTTDCIVEVWLPKSNDVE